MSVFATVTLAWQGKEYQVPPNKMMRTIDAIEEHITLSELVSFQTTRSMRFVKLANAYAAALRSAGATVTGEEVYANLFEGGDAMGKYVAAIEELVTMMVPPKSMQSGMKAAEGSQMGNGVPTGAKAPSRKPTRRRSGTSASSRKSSGG